MSSQFQNRLVGVTILVASVVIFLPSIMDGKKATYEDEFVATPIKPQLREHTQQIAPKANISTETEQVEPNNKPNNKPNNEWKIEEVAAPVTLSDTPPEQQQTKANISKAVANVNKAWSIQLGAFRNAKNINSLLKKLHKAGFDANTIPIEVIDGDLTRVFIGPNVSKKKLEKLLPQLKRLTKLQGKLIPFNAVKP